MFSLRQRGSPKHIRAASTFCLGLLCSVVCSTCIGQAPPNDNFTNAIVLYGNSTTFSGTLSNATFEPGEATNACNVHNFADVASVWWSWTATNSTTVVIDLLETTGISYGGLSVHTGSALDSLTDLDCSVLDSFTHRYVRFIATAGTTYHIRLWGLPRSVTLRLTASNAPIILSPPQSQTVAESASVMFGVIAGGLPPLKYQWQFAGNALTGQTAPTLVLHYLAAGRAGSYSVVVSNSSGATTSSVATLTISPTNPPLLLAPVNSPDTNYFSFSLAGEAGSSYRVFSTTNLVDWMDERSLAPYWFPSVVRNANATSVYSIPIATGQKFLRVSHYDYTEMCIAQLQAINHAIKLWTIETKAAPDSGVTEQDVTPYLNGPFVCPFGGTTFGDSYSLLTVWDRPTCQKVPAVHVLW